MLKTQRASSILRIHKTLLNKSSIAPNDRYAALTLLKACWSSSSGASQFDHRTSFKDVKPPAPGWKLGAGLDTSLSEGALQWKEDIQNSKRKTWDLTSMESMRDSYKLLTSAIIPRPIAFVSTLSEDGVPNLAPFSYFSMVSANPPLLSVSFSLSPRRPKDTRENILKTKEFTVNIISEAFAEAANVTSAESPASTDEWILSGLTKESSTLVKPPFVRESAVSFECELYSSQDIGLPETSNPTTTLVLGLIKKVHVREGALAEDGLSIDAAKLRPIARLGGKGYSRLTEGFELPRVSWKESKEEYRRLADQSSEKS
ncbi:hypothetical protein CPB83DRAFT_852592 [Crepidotus variabilis]|uniref:Flavin reductase like domain-containing protein n=1 Tax=Crepidotus variabilis TaxID=179855 RepID=A0A9P6EHY5_9AGAR|nr:hypothetical protein CPB83DRAFT_852592 [Crepidotus variabilis]